MRGRSRGKRPADDGWAERGGYMQAKIQKLADQNTSDMQDTRVFKGVSIHVNGYTKPTSSELKTMVTENGGTYHHYYSKMKVTHIIASNLPTSKISHLKNEKVVSPDWIVDSLKAGKLLPYQKYLLYDLQKLQQCNIATSLKAFCQVSSDSNSTEVADSVATENLEVADDDDDDDFKDSVPQTLVKSHSNSSSTSSTNKSVRAGQQNFVADFYDRSRLHHISMWGAESKAYVASLQAGSAGDKPTRAFEGAEKLREEIRTSDNPSGHSLPNGAKVYAHIDIDCFFVSVGLLKKPELVGRPVAVTHFKGRNPQSLRADGQSIEHGSRSDIASCSYEARKAGVSNGMHFGEAQKICPNLVAIPYDFEAYRETSRKFYDTVLSYTLDMEAVSCDEMYIDCSELIRQTGASPLQLASSIRRDIFCATGCNSSCGLGGNMLVARLSTKLAKPNGQYHVESGTETEFMKTIRVSDLPGGF